MSAWKYGCGVILFSMAAHGAAPAARPQNSNLCPASLALTTDVAIAEEWLTKKPRAAVEDCLRPHITLPPDDGPTSPPAPATLSDPKFLQSAPADEEHFLYLYLQATQRAARQTKEKANKGTFYREGRTLALTYVTWYTSQAKTLPPSQRRIGDVVFQLGDIDKELTDWNDLLNEYSTYAHTNPELLSDHRTLITWLTALQSAEDDPNGQTHKTVTNEDWALYESTLTTLERTHKYGRDIAKAHKAAKEALK